MSHVLRWMSRAPWQTYLAVTLTLLTFAALIRFYEVDLDAKREAAFRNGPPRPVAVEKFSFVTDVGPLDEINIIGQIDYDRRVRMTDTKKDGTVRERWTLIPVYAADDPGGTRAAPGLIVADRDIGRDEIDRMTIGQGMVGAVLRIDGTLVERYDSRGLAAPNAVMVDPFQYGRREGLRSTGPLVSIPTLCLAIMMGGFTLLRRRAQRLEQAQYRADYDELAR